MKVANQIIDTFAHSVGRDVTERVISVVCRTRGLRYVSGMGTWFFVHVERDEILHDGVWPDVDTCPEDWPADYDALSAFLNSRLGAGTVSDYTEDYTP